MDVHPDDGLDGEIRGAENGNAVEIQRQKQREQPEAGRHRGPVPPDVAASDGADAGGDGADGYETDDDIDVRDGNEHPRVARQRLHGQPLEGGAERQRQRRNRQHRGQRRNVLLRPRPRLRAGAHGRPVDMCR